MQHDLFQDRLEISYGRPSATSDFMTSPYYCQFVTNGLPEIDNALVLGFEFGVTF